MQRRERDRTEIERWRETLRDKETEKVRERQRHPDRCKETVRQI